jgi:DNA polymerase elongation subunit (family B)
VYTIDIETETEDGFPEPDTAGEQILLITIKDTKHNQIITWGLHPFDEKIDHVDYRYFSSEQSMLKDFIVWWQQNCPDVITGWNSRFFDLPYLYNRMCRVLGDTLANKISPWGQCRLIDVQRFGSHDRVRKKLSIAGVADLDYLELYKKFTYSAQESYKLDYIASVELGEQKLANPTGTGQFKAFYSGEFDVPNKPSDDAHEIERKGYIRSQMKKELQRRGLLPGKR